MKSNIMTSLILNPRPLVATLVTLCLAGSLSAQEPTRYSAKPNGSKCEMAGTSSLHDWTMETAIISGSMEVAPGFPEAALTDPAAARPKTTVSMPVSAFKSGKATMDEKMQASMNVTKYRSINYRLIELKPVSKPGDTGPLKFNAVGELTIVGKTVTNTMPVTIEKSTEKNLGLLKVVGTADVKMTSHGMEPPRINLPLLPDITVGDDLKIKFEWVLTERPKAKAE
jgi:polyisoprenoid-binding protein YceI